MELHNIMKAIDTPGTMHNNIVNNAWNKIKIIHPYHEFLNDSNKLGLNTMPFSNETTLKADRIKIDNPAEAKSVTKTTNIFMINFFLLVENIR